MRLPSMVSVLVLQDFLEIVDSAVAGRFRTDQEPP